MANKVFCDQCKYYKCESLSKCPETFDNENIHERCESPNNKRCDYKQELTDCYQSSPSIINRFNNCQWFDQKDPVDNSDNTNDAYIELP